MRRTPEQGTIGPSAWRATAIAWAPIGLILVTALLFHLIAIDHLPGINGDEAWYGVLAQNIATGGHPAWRTPTGNLPGPFQLGMLLIFEPLFKPEFALLRVPSLLSSIAAAALGFWVIRHFFGLAAGLVALLLFASLPIHIAYARFGWDPSHVPLIGIAAVGCALANRPVLCAAAFAIALTAHPTSIFIAPFLVLTLVGAARAEGRGWRDASLRGGLLVLLLTASLGVLMLTVSGGNASIKTHAVIDRLIDPRQWAIFLLLYGRLLSGETVYQFIAGSGFGAIRPIVDIASAVIVAGLTLAGLRALRRQPFGREAGVVLGWLATLFGFFLIAGNDAMMPHFERYAVCLTAPSIVAFAVLAREVGGGDRPSRWPLAATCLIASLLLAGFAQNYLRALAATGGLSHRAFHTGATEPKRAAFDAVLAEARGRPVRLMAEDWWIAWPLTYLAAGRAIEVVDVSAHRSPPVEPGTLWLTFGGSDLDRRLKALPGMELRRTVPGSGRPELLHLWRTTRSSNARTRATNQSAESASTNRA
jgi:hypothetical protein